MPNRVLRDGIRTSERINALPHRTRWLYIMLLTVADDFGRWYADPRLVSGTCLPFDGQAPDKVQDMLDALHKADAIAIYGDNGRKYLQIQQWKQRTRADCSKYPEPQGLVDIGGHMSVKCPTNDGLDVDVDEDVDEDVDVKARCRQVTDTAPPVMSIPLAGGKEFHVTDQYVTELAESYDGIDVLIELKACRQWNRDNATKRKTARGIKRHISTWLHTAQNRGHSRKDAPAPGRPGPRTQWNLKEQMEAIRVERLELWNKYGFDSKSGRSEHPEEWAAYRELLARERALGAEKAGTE